MKTISNQSRPYGTLGLVTTGLIIIGGRIGS
jgi:hypothetical protein